MDLKKLGQNIKTFRTEAGLSQRDLAEKIGVTAASLSAYERGTQTPSIEVVSAIADVFEVRIDWLCAKSYSLSFYGSDNPRINRLNMAEALNGFMAIATDPDLMMIGIDVDSCEVEEMKFMSDHLESFLIEAYRLEEFKQSRAFYNVASKQLQKNIFLGHELHSTLISSYANLILNELYDRNGVPHLKNDSHEQDNEEPPF